MYVFYLSLFFKQANGNAKSYKLEGKKKTENKLYVKAKIVD